MDEIIYNEPINIDGQAFLPSYKMIALRGLVVFPGQSLHFDLARDKSLLALNKAMDDKEDIFLVSQKHSGVANPGPKDIYRVGTLAKIKQIIKMPNGTVRVLVTGKERMTIENYTAISPFFEVKLMPFEQKPSDPVALEAVKRALVEELEKFKKLDNKIPAEILGTISVEVSDDFMAVMGTHLFDDTGKQKLLQTSDLYTQYETVLIQLVKEGEIKLTEKKIALKVRENIDKNQREYFLREQLKVIHDELGDNESEIEEYREKGKAKNFPKEIEEKFQKELSRMDKMNLTSPEAGVIRTYLDWLLDLPWNNMSKENGDLNKAREILDDDHYGLNKVKQRILEYLAVHKLTKTLKSPILCFVGPPGVGKTSIVASIARASGRKMVSMSLGGVRDEAEIRGHRRTYIGALPGRIISCMKQAGVANPVFLLDEIDKMSSDFRGDPTSAMLEVLDPNQNCKFKDHYVELPFDLSNVMFVATANTLESIPLPLVDRMEIIELSGYTYDEKLQIAKKYLAPNQIKANGLKLEDVELSDAFIQEIIIKYTRESGVRSLEREIGAVVRKMAVLKATSEEKNLKFAPVPEEITQYLGIERYKEKSRSVKRIAGLATGLAWTAVGGVTMNIEVALLPNGKGDILLTGSLGDVMKESCQTALSLVKSLAPKYSIDYEKFLKNDIHIHVPEGATPKDGPSAGITMATALLSAMTGKPVNPELAMTGEVTLLGDVLAIGGLKEKSLAALRSGIKKLVIPSENKKDLDDIPLEVKQSIDLIFADSISDVFNAALN